MDIIVDSLVLGCICCVIPEIVNCKQFQQAQKCEKNLTFRLFSFQHYLGLFYFEFKIRLIRLALSFQKHKFLCFNSQPTDFQSGVITIIPKSQLCEGDTDKAFSNLQSCLTDSSLIHLSLLIKLIQNKIEKKHHYLHSNLFYFVQYTIFVHGSQRINFSSFNVHFQIIHDRLYVQDRNDHENKQNNISHIYIFGFILC